MFNKINADTFGKIKNMCYEAHMLYVFTVEHLNGLFNAQYCPKYLKNDILDIFENDIYDVETCPFWF